MKNELDTLDQLLRSKRPEFYEKLNSPLTNEEIEKLEKKFNVKLPTDLITLYSWKNGQANNCFRSFVNNSTFIPLEESLSTAAEMTSMIGFDFKIENWWNKNWLPVFSNGGGSHICYDLQGTFTGQRGQLIAFWKSGNDRNVISPDLLSFIKQLNTYYTTTPIESFDSYFEIENINGFPQKYIVQ